MAQKVIVLGHDFTFRFPGLDLTGDKHAPFAMLGDWYVQMPNGLLLLVERGAPTNIASIPWFVRWLISMSDATIIKAAIAHDRLVNEFTDKPPVLYRVWSYTCPVEYEITRETADWDKAALWMKDLMYRNGAKGNQSWKRYVVWYAVRLNKVFKKLKREL